jgi:serine/threonine protein kinase
MWVEGREFGAGRYRISDSKPLGQGTDATVYEAIDVQQGISVAVKVIDRLEVDDDDQRLRQLERELNITRKLSHPNIINLLDVVFEDDWVLLVIELAGGGSLFDEVAGTPDPVPEERARSFFQQILSALEYCHDRQIFHRDLKLENIVFSAPPERTLKVTDFGVSKDAGINSMPKTNVGTIAYMAPEVTNVGRRDEASTYGGAADIWSLGVILFVMVAQEYPFGFDGPRHSGGISAAAVYKRIREGVFTVPAAASTELAELLHGMLMTDTRERWGFEQIKSCSWMAQGAPYVAQIGAPTVAAGGDGDAGALSSDIKIPPRSQPRMRAAGSSFGSFGGSFLGFPSFSEAGAGGGLLSSGGGAHVSSMAGRTSAMPPSDSFEGPGSLTTGMSGLDLDGMDDPGGYSTDDQPTSIGSEFSMGSMGAQTPPSVRMTGHGPPVGEVDKGDGDEDERGF